MFAVTNIDDLLVLALFFGQAAGHRAGVFRVLAGAVPRDVPVFTTTNAASLATYAAAFLVMVGAWCALGLFSATRPMVARALSRSGHVLLPVVLIGIGLLILVQGGAFGL
jgi:cadmium resistance protein CadD (predicted permease)